MSKEMIVNAFVPDNVRVAILDSKRLDAFFEDFAQDHRSRSNIYLGRIIHVEPSLDACFVEFGSERHGFLPFSEIAPIYKQPKTQSKTNEKRVNGKVKRGQLLVVQVDKEASGNKGAKLTTFLSLAGRYMVLMPYSDTRGVSRKIDNPETRKDRKEIVDKLNVPKGMGLILRTAGEDKNKRELTRDLNYLIRLWKDIQKKARSSSGPVLIHAEADLIVRILRDYYMPDVERVWIDDKVAFSKAETFFKLFMPRQKHKLAFFSGKIPIFSHFGVENQIEEIHSRRVSLPSGGSLVIDQTEALVAIDVNSGKMKGKNQETTVYQTNLEASKEIARQLTLRDLGGIIVIDFIDMFAALQKTMVERTLRDELRKGKARTKISKISAFGLCTLTRQRLGKSIRTMGQRECPTCLGSGLVPDLDVVSMRLLRKLRAEAASAEFSSILVKLNTEFANHFQNRFRTDLTAIESELDIKIVVEASFSGKTTGFDLIYSERTKSEIKPNQDSKPKSMPRPEHDRKSKSETEAKRPNSKSNSSHFKSHKKPPKQTKNPTKKPTQKEPVSDSTSSAPGQPEKKQVKSSLAKPRPKKRNWRRRKKTSADEPTKESSSSIVLETPHSVGSQISPLEDKSIPADPLKSENSAMLEKKIPTDRTQKKRRRWRKKKPSVIKKDATNDSPATKESMHDTHKDSPEES